MTPEDPGTIAAYKRSVAHLKELADSLLRQRDELVVEVQQLQAGLIEARLAAEEAWDAYDNVLEEKRSR